MKTKEIYLDLLNVKAQIKELKNEIVLSIPAIVFNEKHMDLEFCTIDKQKNRILITLK